MRWTGRLGESLFRPQTDAWLTMLRVGLGIQTIFYAVSLQYDWNYLFARTGHELVGPELPEALLSTQSPLVPRLGWLTALGMRVGLSEWLVLSIAWWLLLFAGAALVAGIFSRACAIAAWLVHLSAAKSAGFLCYGVDNFMTIGFFYLVLAPLPDRWSVDQRWQKARPQDRQLLGFWRHVLQLHLCVIYFFSGLTKALGTGWWDGSNLWHALIRPPFNVLSPEILVHWKYLFPVAGIAIALLELNYPFFIWGSRTRAIWLAGICIMHIAIGLAMGMYLFALVMIVLNLAAFAPNEFVSKIRGLTGTNREQPETWREAKAH
jgi:hypothetical protein